MAFMSPEADYMTMYHVDTNCGTELVPEEVCGEIDLNAEPTREEWDHLLTYCEGNRIEGVEKHTGWYARLSAPGYLDCTPWTGPYARLDEALNELCDFYGIDENGDDLDTEE